MHVPEATYRIQFNLACPFRSAKKHIPYLHRLGISHVYASPIFKARKGSTHGYDVVDSNTLNPELGGAHDFEELVGELQKHGMHWLLDIVPNHMAYDSGNHLLMDVFEYGRSSACSRFFDIEWDHPYESMRGRLLAPFLGRFYGESLENGEIRLEYGKDGLSINYCNLKFPLKIESYAQFLTHRLSSIEEKLGSRHPDYLELIGILHTLRNLPSQGRINERYEQVRAAKRMLWNLYSENPGIKGFIDRNITVFNGKKGDPESYDLLEQVLADQVFRLSFWKVATEEINYRRFFNINALVCLRVEDEAVFDQTHRLILRLVGEGKVSGLRIDHFDGLYHPIEYLKRVRERAKDAYIVVEKILNLAEHLPISWRVQGTTGYDFLNYLNGLFCEKKNERKFSRIYSRFTGFKTPFDDLVAEKKRLITGKHMAGNIDNLARLMKGISSRDRYGKDITLYGLKRALVEVMAFFPVYRTYVNHEMFSEMDRFYIEQAVKKATRKNPGLLHEIAFIERFFLLASENVSNKEERTRLIRFVMRFQQFTGPLMAKGFEDTVLYVYNRLLSLNEVGGSPDRFGISVSEFHEFNRKRLEFWPHSLNATSTHDTKRGEDVRARLNVLSEIPQEWESNVKMWRRLNRRKKAIVDGARAPDENDEYSLYQTLVGAFPFAEGEYALFLARMREYVVKAVREAKVHTAWLKPDTEYEEASVAFVEQILTATNDNDFLNAFLPFQRRVAYYGIFNSLAQTLLKMTSPGVPDFYQGTELWDFNLVDPDNRRPVDFQRRESVLDHIRVKTHADILNLISELLSSKEDGRIKLFLIYRVLQARRKKREVFQAGAYLPLEIEGEFKNHVIAYSRCSRNAWTIIVAPRFLTGLIEENGLPLDRRVWHDTSIVLPEKAPLFWHHVITDQRIEGTKALPVADLLKYFPLALLINEEEPL